MNTHNTLPSGGHAPGELREALLAAIEAYEDWKDGPEPEVDVGDHSTPISQVCGLLWNCTDLIPNTAWSRLDAPEGDTYACSARALKAMISEREAK